MVQVVIVILTTTYFDLISHSFFDRVDFFLAEFQVRLVSMCCCCWSVGVQALKAN